jgi:hypothetical protein
MTYDDYNRIALGESISNVQVQLGRPYEMNELPGKKQEYVWVERVQIGEKRELFRRFILVVEDEKVVKKRVTEQVSSPIQFIAP